MKNIVTIGGGNGHSSILKGLYKNFDKNNSWDDFSISAIVSMSDDGRTTGLLMREMQDELGLHMPPPGDLRRCFFSLSSSEYRDEFEKILEYVIDFDEKIKNLKLINILERLHESEGFIKNLENHDKKFLNFKLPLDSSIKGHKFGNILMAILFYNLKDYSKMVEFMSFLLDVKGEVLPITEDKAFIKAILEDGDIIETQDKISNVVDYDSAIERIELMDNPENAKLNKGIKEVIEKADYIIIGPGDLFTSIDANFIIPGFLDLLNTSNAKKFYVLNSNNKKGETTGYTILDFVDFVQNKLDNKIDYIVGNSVLPKLNNFQLKKFKNDISVKGGDFLVIDDEIKKEILDKYSNLEIINGDYVDIESVYKYNDKMIDDLSSFFVK